MKAQMKFQKIVCLVCLIASVVAFVYGLGICTDLQSFLYYLSAEGKTPLVGGANIYFDIQPFNAEFVNGAIVSIIISVTLFITMTNTRRKYYISNFVSAGAVVVYNLYFFIKHIPTCMAFRAQYVNGVDWDAAAYWGETYGLTYTDSTFWFDAIYIAFAVMMIALVLLVANFIWKILLIKRENRLLAMNKGVGTNE